MTQNTTHNGLEDRAPAHKKRNKHNYAASVVQRPRKNGSIVWAVVYRRQGRQMSRSFTTVLAATTWRDIYRLAGPSVAYFALDENPPARPPQTPGRAHSPRLLKRLVETVPTAAAPIPSSRDWVAMPTSPTFDDLPVLSTLSEAAALLKVSRGYLLKLVERREICGVKAGKTWLIPRRALVHRTSEDHRHAFGGEGVHHTVLVDGIADDLLSTLDEVSDARAVASILRITQRTLGDLTRAGTIPGMKEGTRWTYSSRQLVVALMATIPASPQTTPPISDAHTSARGR